MSQANSLHLGSAGVGLVLILVLVGVIYALTVGTFPAMDPMVGSSVDERLKPVGQVRVAGGSEATAPAAAPAAAAASGEAASGEAIYAKACVVCHCKRGGRGAETGRQGGLEGACCTGYGCVAHYRDQRQGRNAAARYLWYLFGRRPAGGDRIHGVHG